MLQNKSLDHCDEVGFYNILTYVLYEHFLENVCFNSFVIPRN